MSQPITILAVGDKVCMKETIGGTTSNVPFRVICTPENNPYGNDRYLVVREYATGTGANESTFKFNTSSSNVEYEDSNLDAFMTGEYAGRFDAATLACIATSTVVCYHFTNSATYSIARKFFALSNKELGGNYTSDESVSLGYFTSNALRITYTKAGTAVYVWTRSPASASTVCYVSYYGGLSSNSPTYSYSARPALNLLSSSLISSEANEDGSYNLVPDENVPPQKAGFTALLGETETIPKQIKVECETVCDGSLRVYVCNNYKDAEPTWEKTALGAAYTFLNATKTADTWAVGVKIEAESESNIILYEPIAAVICEGVST